MIRNFMTWLFVRHRLVGVTLTLCLCVGLWWLWSGRINSWSIANLRAPAGKDFNESVVVFGDSLTAGVGASAEEFKYVARVQASLGVSVVNAGISGDTTRSGLARLSSVLAYKPRVLILLLGGNDMLTKIPMEETMSNLEKIIMAFQDEGAMVVLVGIQAPYIGGKYGKAFRALARRRGCVYVPHILKGILGTPSLMSDQIHPNDKGYALVAERICAVGGDYIKRALHSE